MDLYTKIILTVIAIMLVLGLLRDVNKVGAGDITDVNIAEVGGYIVRGGVVEVKGTLK